MEKNKKYTCPVCGYKVFTKTAGSFEICPICFWQDDVVDLQEMYKPMGPNKVSLEQAQKNYKEFGASEKRLLEHVRQPIGEEKDKDWRALDRQKDKPKEIDTNVEDIKKHYYWYWN